VDLGTTVTNIGDRSKKRVLIVGSEGFIGQHLVAELKSLDRYEVHSCDIVASQRSSRHSLIDPDNVEFDSLFQSQAIDVCINCSGAASVGESHVNPRRDHELNVVNVVRILDAIRRNVPGCRFLNLSSAAVYGNPTVLPVREGAENHPISPYGLHKLQAEQICEGYMQFFDLKTCSVRIFSAYGPGLRKQLFWDLHRKAQDSESIELWGTGTESRDFIEITDLCRAIRIVSENSNFAGESINVASGKEVLIRDAVGLFFSFYDPARSFRFNGQTKAGDPRNWCADISQLESMGFRPEVSISAGLEGYVSWLKERADV